MAVAALMLLLSVVVMWKLELSLPPNSVTTGFGALTLAVVIWKYWVTRRTLTDTDTGAKHRKFENQQHSEVHPEKRRETTTYILFSPAWYSLCHSSVNSLRSGLRRGGIYVQL